MKYKEIMHELLPVFCLSKGSGQVLSEREDWWIDIIVFEKYQEDKMLCYRIKVFKEGYEDNEEPTPTETTITSLTAEETYKAIFDWSYKKMNFTEKEIAEKRLSGLINFEDREKALEELDVSVFDIKEIFKTYQQKNLKILEWRATETSNSGKTIYKSDPSNAHRLRQLNKVNGASYSRGLFDPAATPDNYRLVANEIYKIKEALERLYYWVEYFNDQYCGEQPSSTENNIAAFIINLRIRDKIADFAKYLKSSNYEYLLQDKIEVGIRRRG